VNENEFLMHKKKPRNICEAFCVSVEAKEPMSNQNELLFSDLERWDKIQNK
jgi:hypothetical protein